MPPKPDLIALGDRAGGHAVIVTGHDGHGLDVIAQDGDGRTQWLTGLFRTAAIREKFLALPSTDVSVRAALEGLTLATLAPPAGENRIWEDMDTPEDFQRVQEELS